jgi:hypothetical protein
MALADTPRDHSRALVVRSRSQVVLDATRLGRHHFARAIPDRSRLLDRCARCELLNPPRVVADACAPDDFLVGCYSCPRCGYSWWTSWDREFVT